MKPTAKPSWFIILPFIGIVVLCALWSLYWFTAATKAEELLNQALAREQQKGLTITCANRNIQGFPFKFRLHCDALKIVHETPTRLTTLTAGRFVAAAMAYNYNHMIAEIYGPFDITRSRKQNRSTTIIETRKLFHGNAKTIKASLILKNQAIKQSTIVVKELTGTLFDYTIKTKPQNIETKLQETILHIRAAGSMANPIGPYDVSGAGNNLSFVGGIANIQSAKGTKIDDFLVRLNVTKAPYTLFGKPLDLLKKWQARAGEVTIAELTVNNGPLKLKGKGKGTLDATGRAQGTLKMQIIGLDELVKNLVAAGNIREKDATIGLAAIQLLGGNSNNGVKIALRATKGNLYFGPFQIARLIPLFQR